MAEDLEVRPGLVIAGSELEERFTASGGPGGQHANRSQTRVELRFDVAASTSLSEGQRRQVREALGNEVRVVCDEERSQSRNREIARRRMAGRLRAALVRQAPRRPTRPTRASTTRRLQDKARRGELKRQRRPPAGD